jgi:protein-tyrosine phosphatase
VTRVLFVCLGNICRSPLAEGLARARAEAAGLDWEFDSAGTGAHYHAGAPPDPRTCASARRRGIALDELRARQVAVADFSRFDLILAADRQNLRALEAMRPARASARVALLLDWTGVQPQGEVPDPYYGDEPEFEAVCRLLERAVDALLARSARA